MTVLLIAVCDGLHFSAPTSRRSAVAAIFAFVQPAHATEAQRSLQAFGDGTRKLSDEGIGEGELIAELLRRTEANKERNAAIVKRTTEANAYTAIDGSIDRRLVTGLDGRNLYLDQRQIRELISQRKLACAPSVMEPCRMVVPTYDDAAPLQLPEYRKRDDP